MSEDLGMERINEASFMKIYYVWNSVYIAMILPAILYLIRRIQLEINQSILDIFRMIQYVLILIVFNVMLITEIMATFFTKTILVAYKLQFFTTFNIITFEIASQL